MPVTAAAPVPYAPPSAILELIRRHRSRGLPPPINADVLGRAGISLSLIPRTMQALETLDLIDGNGAPTASLESLRLAPEDGFKNALAQWLQGAYADVLTYIDPATATEIQVRDAFRTYNPTGQQPRMVTLFIQLFAAAGIGPEKAMKTKPTGSGPASHTMSFIKKAKAMAAAKSGAGTSATLPPALAGLLSSLPASGKNWTQAQRDKFMKTFGAVLDFVVPVGEPVEEDDDGDDMAA